MVQAFIILDVLIETFLVNNTNIYLKNNEIITVLNCKRFQKKTRDTKFSVIEMLGPWEEWKSKWKREKSKIAIEINLLRAIILAK